MNLNHVIHRGRPVLVFAELLVHDGRLVEGQALWVRQEAPRPRLPVSVPQLHVAEPWGLYADRTLTAAAVGTPPGPSPCLTQRIAVAWAVALTLRSARGPLVVVVVATAALAPAPSVVFGGLVHARRLLEHRGGVRSQPLRKAACPGKRSRPKTAGPKGCSEKEVSVSVSKNSLKSSEPSSVDALSSHDDSPSPSLPDDEEDDEELSPFSFSVSSSPPLEDDWRMESTC